MERRNFFISYAKEDKDWAVWIANVLKKNGYSVYVQALDIHPGDNFLEKMEEFLENSTNFIAVWSKSYSKSGYCMNEMRSAYQACHENLMGCLLPVRIDKYPIRRLYAALVHVDLSDMSAASETELVDAVRDAVAQNMDANALNKRGDDYYFGRNGVNQDYDQARKYYEQAAARSHADALNNLGVLYYDGTGVAQDYDQARKYYEQAAAKGDDYALSNLGELYESGHGVEQDYAKALYYYQKAVAAGCKDAAGDVARVQEKLSG